MAALYAMGIDNCLIQINGPEFPILDGSAAMYVDKIKEIGIIDQNAPKDVLPDTLSDEEAAAKSSEQEHFRSPISFRTSLLIRCLTVILVVLITKVNV